jgi:hypothetical protein
MSKRFHNDWLKAFVTFASFGEAPLKMLYWAGVSTLAGALRRRVWIDQAYFQWIPNFYIIFVAPPGIVSKSTTANIGMNLLRALKYIKFGPDVITWQALVTSLAKSTEAVQSPSGEFRSMSAVTFCSDELGNLLNPNDRDLIDALVTLWDGKQGAFSKETKTSGSDRIENPFVNIIGCTTPAWISGNFPEYLLGGGFTSRCVFLYADLKRQLVPYVDEAVPKDLEVFRSQLVHDLEMVSQLYGQFELTSSARDWGKRWYLDHWKKKPDEIRTEQFEGYMARKQTHLHKLAMVLSASRRDTLIIRETDIVEAADMITALEEDMPKVFARIGQTDITRGSAEIIAAVDSAPGITMTALYNKLFRTLNHEDFQKAIAGALATQKIRSVGREDGIHYYPISKSVPESHLDEQSKDRKAGSS